MNSSVIVFSGIFGGCIAGNGGLNAGRGQGQEKSLDGKNQLIDTKSCSTNGMGEEYSIEESYDPAEKSGHGKNQCAPEKTVLFHKEHLKGSF